MGAPPHAPGDFLMRRKSPKTHQEPPGSWTSGEGGLAPFDPPALCPSGIGCDSLNPQASSVATLPCHGLKTQSVPSMKPKEKTRPICPQTQSGKSVFFCGTSPFEGVAARCAAGGAKRPPRGVPRGGPPLGDSLVTFSSGRKSPGCRAERLHGGSRGSRSCKIPPLVAAGTQKETAQLLTAPSLWCLCIGKLSD